MGENSVAKTNMPSTNKGFTFEVVLLDGEHVNIEMDVSFHLCFLIYKFI